MVGILWLFGVALLVAGFQPYLALAALLFALLTLVGQYFQARKYWMHSLVRENDASPGS